MLSSGRIFNSSPGRQALKSDDMAFNCRSDVTHKQVLLPGTYCTWPVKDLNIVYNKSPESLKSPEFRFPWYKNEKFILGIYRECYTNKETQLFVYLHISNLIVERLKFMVIFVIRNKRNQIVVGPCCKILKCSWGNTRIALMTESDAKMKFYEQDTCTVHVYVYPVAPFDSPNINVIEEANASTAEHDSRSGGEIWQDIGNLLKNDAHSDVTFVVDDVRIPAHKVILSSRSPVFEEIFLNPDFEGEVKIVNVQSHVILEMLRYVYSDAVYNLAKNAMDLITVADKYAIHGLRDMCTNYLIGNIRVDNVINILVFAYKNNVVDLKERARAFIKENKSYVIVKPEFKNLLKLDEDFTTMLFYYLAL